MLVPRLTDYVLARIYEGIDQSAFSSGFTTFVANTADQPALRVQRLEEFLSRRPEGIVLGDARLDEDRVVEALDRRGIPYVLTSRRLEGCPSATTDDVRGGRLAGHHLVALGHSRVGVVAGEAYASTGVDRTAGFLGALAEAGVEVAPDQVLRSRFDTEGGRAAADELLARHPDLTAIFAVNDTAAIGAMGAVRASGATSAATSRWSATTTSRSPPSSPCRSPPWPRPCSRWAAAPPSSSWSGSAGATPSRSSSSPSSGSASRPPG